MPSFTSYFWKSLESIFNVLTCKCLKYSAQILGQVEVDIEMDSGNTVTFKTSPVNVAIIMAFQEQGMKGKTPYFIC